MSDVDDDVQFESDDDVEASSHNKLLSAVSRLYKKQRVENAKRTEPAREVSEFHLSAPGAEGGKASDPLSTAAASVGVKELLGSLNHSAKQKKIKDRIHNIKTLAETLSAPLEKIESEKIKRSVGYDNAKTQVSRWDGLVEKNRLAPELCFPLPAPRERIRNKPLGFASAFTKPTELELKLAEVLRDSKVTKKSEKMEEPKESVFKMTMKEMMKQRQVMKKIKAQESFKIVKAMKQNKIKSKKYRRLLRKEKAKEELKEFEALKAVDPEAALEQLEKDEKERALERASLRHRNTGRWAKGLAVRAKYDKEARKELADQVAKSRELTLKKKLEEEGEDSATSDEDTERPVRNSSDNPWMNETGGPDISVSDFMKGYQSYWKNKNAAEEKEKKDQEDSIVKGLVQNVPKDDEESPKNRTVKYASDSSDDGSEESEEPENADIFDTSDNIIIPSERKLVTNSSGYNSNEESSSDELVSETKSKSSTSSNKSIPSKIRSNLLGKSPQKRPDAAQDSSDDESTLLKDLKAVTNSSEIEVDSSLFSVSKLLINKKKSQRRKVKRRKEGLWAVDEEIELNVEKDKTNSKNENSQKSLGNLNEDLRNIGDMFDKVEDRLQEQVDEKLNRREKSLKGVKDKRRIDISEDSDFVVVKKKKRGSKNEANIETSRALQSNRSEESEEINDAISTLMVSGQAKQHSSSGPGGLINPNEYMVVQPRRMAHEAGDISLPSDLVDDDEPEVPEGNPAKDLAEAFADDDLVSDFRNEKAAAEKVKHELDLTLPGWGSWGGSGIEEKTKKKRRRKRRFVLAFAPAQLAPQPKKENVIINSEAESALKDMRVKRLPAPFASEKAFELSVRAPIGRDWQSEVAFDGLTRPPVSTKAGAIIRPMAEDQLKLYDKKVRLAVYKTTVKNKRKPLG